MVDTISGGFAGVMWRRVNMPRANEVRGLGSTWFVRFFGLDAEQNGLAKAKHSTRAHIKLLKSSPPSGVTASAPALRLSGHRRSFALLMCCGRHHHKLELEGKINSQRNKIAGFEGGLPDQGSAFSTHCARARDRKAATSLLRTCRSCWSGDSSQRSRNVTTFCPRVRSMSGLFLRHTTARTLSI